MLRLLEGEPQGVALSGVPLSEASFSVLLQVASQIRVRLRRAQPHRGEWVLLAGALVVWPPEVLPLVGSLRQVLPLQVQLVSLPQEPLHPE